MSYHRFKMRGGETNLTELLIITILILAAFVILQVVAHGGFKNAYAHNKTIVINKIKTKTETFTRGRRK